MGPCTTLGHLKILSEVLHNVSAVRHANRIDKISRKVSSINPEWQNVLTCSDLSVFSATEKLLRDFCVRKIKWKLRADLFQGSIKVCLELKKVENHWLRGVPG